jgi:D-hexose-6-phosphate mutarotase
MDELTTLNARFSIPGIVKFDAGKGGLPRVVITSRAADAEIYLQGAHVTHFQPVGHKPVLFMSAKSHFSADKPIRGGVPVIFPWFGPKAGDASAPAHGFVRTLAWDVREVTKGNDAIVISLGLKPSDATHRWLPDEFELIYRVSVGATLELSLLVRNLSFTTFSFEEALHTYFQVGDIQQVNVEGLAGRTYLDKPAGMQRKTQKGTIRFEGETDRVYLNTADTTVASDPILHRRISVAKEGSGTTVVWNPWIAKAKAMPDFGDDEWPDMLCIETANATENAIHLPAGQSHTLRAIIGIENM